MEFMFSIFWTFKKVLIDVLAVFLDSICNTQMLGIKYACSMKKMMMIKNKKLEEIN
jgi:hypothetical protein